MIPKKPKSKPSIESALLEWNVIFSRVLDSIHEAQQVGHERSESYSETAVEVAAGVAAEIWKGVDHGDDA